MVRVRPATCARTIVEPDSSRIWGQGWGISAHKIFIWDREGIYRDCQYPNPVHGHFLGGKALIGKTIQEVLGQPEAQAVLSAINRTWASAQPTETEWIWKTHAGTFQTCIRFFPIMNVVMGLVTDRLVTRLERPPGKLLRLEENSQGYQEADLRHLTQRERQIIAEIRTGKTNKEVAHTFHISLRTVKFHLSNIFHKLQISSRESLQEARLVSRWQRGPSSDTRGKVPDTRPGSDIPKGVEPILRSPGETDY